MREVNSGDARPNPTVNNSDSVANCVDVDSHEELQDRNNRKEGRDNLLRKVEMPVFKGINAFGWITKVERFFTIGKYSEAEKLRIVSLSLDGNVEQIW